MRAMRTEKVRDIVGLHAMVLCVDEKSQIQALNRTQPTLPMGLGLPDRPGSLHRSTAQTQAVASEASPQTNEHVNRA